MIFISIFVSLQLVLLCICSFFILKQQHEIDVSKELNLQSRRLLEELSARNEDPVEYETYNRRLTSSPITNCSAVIDKALVPVGTIMDFAGSVAPAGFLLCDGSAVSRTKYSTLLAVIGITYGIGDSLTTFNLPDFRGRMTIGAGSGSGLSVRSLGDHGGEEKHLLSQGELSAHSHVDSGHFHTSSDPTNGGRFFGWGTANNVASWQVVSGNGPNGYGGSAPVTMTTVSANIQPTGDNLAHNNMPSFGVTNKIIKY
jgi:microcystin-dependent protein